MAPNSDLLPLTLSAFADLGYEGASVRALCRRLGVSHNLLYQRFGSKEQLWYAAVDHGFAILASDMADAAVEAEQLDDDLARLRFMMIRWLERMATSPDLAKIINQEAAAGGERMTYMFERYIAPNTDYIIRFIRKLERQGRVRHVEPGTWHFLVMHGAGGPLSLVALADLFGMTPRGARQVHDYASEVVDLLLTGISAG